MYGLSRHHSHYNTSTFTQTYWKDHLIEITIERARTKRSRHLRALYTNTHHIHHSLCIHVYMICLGIIHITTHPHLHKHIEKIIWSRLWSRDLERKDLDIYELFIWDTPNTLLTNFISMYKWPSWTCVTFPSQPYLHGRFDKTIIWSKVRSRELERKDPNLWVRYSNQHTTHHSLTYYPVLLLWGMGSTCIYPLLHFALF